MPDLELWNEGQVVKPRETMDVDATWQKRIKKPKKIKYKRIEQKMQAWARVDCNHRWTTVDETETSDLGLPGFLFDPSLDLAESEFEDLVFSPQLAPEEREQSRDFEPPPLDSPMATVKDEPQFWQPDSNVLDDSNIVFE